MESSSQDSHPHRLLVVDDHEEISNLIREIAVDLVYQVRCVNHYEEIRPAYRRFAPNVIFLDLDLGQDKDLELAERGFDGLEILQFLSANECDAAIILISGMEKHKLKQTQEIGRELKLNVMGYLSKPFSIEVVEQVLAKLSRRVLKNSIGASQAHP